MTEDVTTTFARTLVDEWVRAGVRHAVLAPGSRSTPMALALADRPELQLHVVIDERSAAFRALGVGKATGMPAVLLCTSGTAAAHFAPAIIEADAARVPMIVCTADRPPELHGMDAPQTINQQFLYGSAVRWFVDAGVPEATAGANDAWRSFADEIVSIARGGVLNPPGPVHCNLPFREPLVPTGEPLLDAPGRADGSPWTTVAPPVHATDAATAQQLVDLVRAHPHGIVTAGWGAGVAPATMRRFARAAGWPVFADVLSNLRTSADVLGAYEAVLRSPGFGDAHRPSIALRVGGLLTSKVTNQWLDPVVPQVLVDPYDTWIDPQRPGMTRLRAAADALLAAAADQLEADPVADAAARASWVEQWLHADHTARTAIDKLLEGWDEPFDGRIARDLVAGIPDGAMLFVASSMPVRDADWFADARTGITISASRGTNGIDGFASTVIGLGAGSGQPVVGLCGDLAFLHDVNGMLGADGVAHLNAVIVVIDNNGGGIFSFLPQAELPAHFEQLWGTPHNRDLAAVAAAYGVVFSHVEDAPDLMPVVQSGLETGGLHVVIVKTDRAINVERHRHVWDVAARALNGAQ